ncbi:hypothetical protein MLD52_19910 [Puniceicoccaceae bacterium K14]|nr:hypothetical protein [Puniceicoccaceae bacterium K14]
MLIGYVVSFLIFVSKSEDFIEKYRYENQPIVTLPHVYSFSDHTESSYIKGKGWLFAESWGSWTDGQNSTLRFKFSKESAGKLLKFEFHIMYSFYEDDNGTADLIVNGAFFESWSGNNIYPRVRTIELQLGPEESEVEISLSIGETRKHFYRELGFGIGSIKVSEVIKNGNI